jgi:phosphoribosyl-AMP cyclohydrolase / phosphoribosyl-ATP pyrophosphohydrolase
MTLDLSSFNANSIDWKKNDGLVPTIIQDAFSLRVLMLGYVNAESLQISLDTQYVTFYSRSKQRLWKKGETSGHVMRLKKISLDCDCDTILMMVEPKGPSCHLGTTTCFDNDDEPSLATLADLSLTIHKRHLSPSSESYTAKLLASGVARIAQKVGEEAIETALAATTQSPTLLDEAADLLYHLLVLLEARDVNLHEVMTILHRRAQKP